MRHFHAVSLASAILVLIPSAVNAQQGQAPQTPRLTDVYHVHMWSAPFEPFLAIASNFSRF